MAIRDVPTLVEPAWLAGHLGDPALRVLDCTVFLSTDPISGTRRVESGRPAWAKAHVPGSAFADLIHDLSDPSIAHYSFPLPPAAQFASVMSRLGVGDGSTVVLYDAAGNMWAARLWWMLRVYGFDRAGVLDGGWRRWLAEGRPVSDAPPVCPPARFTPRPRPELVADRHDVLDAIGRPGSCLLDALGPDSFAGRESRSDGRVGHIPTAVNVPALHPTGIVDPESMTYRPLDALRERFTAAGVLGAERVITYCGGGIAASSAALALHLLGVRHVAVYDGSLSEWRADPSLPLETG